MERQLGTDRRDVPHAFVEGEGQDCQVCQESAGDARHEEWARVERASRQTAATSSLPRVLG